MCFHQSAPPMQTVPPAPAASAANPTAPVMNETPNSATSAEAITPGARRGVNSLTIGLDTPSPSAGGGLAI